MNGNSYVLALFLVWIAVYSVHAFANCVQCSRLIECNGNPPKKETGSRSCSAKSEENGNWVLRFKLSPQTVSNILYVLENYDHSDSKILLRNMKNFVNSHNKNDYFGKRGALYFNFVKRENLEEYGLCKLFFSKSWSQKRTDLEFKIDPDLCFNSLGYITFLSLEFTSSEYSKAIKNIRILTKTTPFQTERIFAPADSEKAVFAKLMPGIQWTNNYLIITEPAFAAGENLLLNLAYNNSTIYDADNENNFMGILIGYAIDENKSIIGAVIKNIDKISLVPISTLSIATTPSNGTREIFFSKHNSRDMIYMYSSLRPKEATSIKAKTAIQITKQLNFSLIDTDEINSENFLVAEKIVNYSEVASTFNSLALDEFNSMKN